MRTAGGGCSDLVAAAEAAIANSRGLQAAVARSLARGAELLGTAKLRTRGLAAEIRRCKFAGRSLRARRAAVVLRRYLALREARREPAVGRGLRPAVDARPPTVPRLGRQPPPRPPPVRMHA